MSINMVREMTYLLRRTLIVVAAAGMYSSDAYSQAGDNPHELVHSPNANEDDIREGLDLSDLAAGTYFVSVTASQQVTTRMIIRE